MGDLYWSSEEGRKRLYQKLENAGWKKVDETKSGIEIFERTDLSKVKTVEEVRQGKAIDRVRVKQFAKDYRR